jgi:hypothetical protein
MMEIPMAESQGQHEPKPPRDAREGHELDVLARDLRGAFAPPRWDPVRLEAMDRAVLAAAIEQSSAARRRRMAIRIGGWGALAAAAGLALAALVTSPGGRAPLGTGRTPIAAAGKDLNGDGIIDILDALMLARTLEDPARNVPAMWDFTGDGLVDRRDVDAIAAAAVRLDDGGRG